MHEERNILQLDSLSYLFFLNCTLEAATHPFISKISINNNKKNSRHISHKNAFFFGLCFLMFKSTFLLFFPVFIHLVMEVLTPLVLDYLLKDIYAANSLGWYTFLSDATARWAYVFRRNRLPLGQKGIILLATKKSSDSLSWDFLSSNVNHCTFMDHLALQELGSGEPGQKSW